MIIFDRLTRSNISIATTNNIVRIFVCGPTLDDNCHVGHARIFVLVSLICRLLQSRNYIPNVIVNITDIDPKLYENNINTNIIFKNLIDDLDRLNIGDLNYARATDYVHESKYLIEKLIKTEFAYSANGNVYLDTSKFPSYGALSHLSKKELWNQRYDIDINKRNVTDIFLWNTSDNYGTQYNDRIFGNGSPWWHIQDTAVAIFHFNGNYDIHIGGVDLCYPHHEVLRALLMAISHKKNPVKCWMHVGILDIESTKMSKSSGNAIYIKDLLKKFDANTLKLYFYSLDYKKLMHFKISELGKFEKMNTLIRNIVSNSAHVSKNYDTKKYYVDESKMSETDTFKKFRNFIDNDLDTHNALTLFLQTVKDPNKMNEARKMMTIFGLEY
ncbi:MAG TPA: class I tRNA ligase family protein [Nitrososphaeraceae archaeon]|nr:class I tRNA ligase family protein [Nitrososphaeraceae archaeon]